MSARYRWMVVSRLLAAVVGGYVAANLFGALLALLLPQVTELTLADAVVIATMLSFVVHALVAVLAFTPASAGRVWCGIAAAAGAMTALLLLLLLLLQLPLMR